MNKARFERPGDPTLPLPSPSYRFPLTFLFFSFPFYFSVLFSSIAHFVAHRTMVLPYSDVLPSPHSSPVGGGWDPLLSTRFAVDVPQRLCLFWARGAGVAGEGGGETIGQPCATEPSCTLRSCLRSSRWFSEQSASRARKMGPLSGTEPRRFATFCPSDLSAIRIRSSTLSIRCNYGM